jgi:hypothetical protein
VLIVRDHVLAGRSFSSLDALDSAFLAWVPVRRATVHRTHGEVIGVRAQGDHAALAPAPARLHIVVGRHLRHVGKDCLVAFEANPYSVPAARVFPRQMVEVGASSAPSACPPPSPTATASPCSRSTSGRSARRPDHRSCPLGRASRRAHPRRDHQPRGPPPGRAAREDSGGGPSGALRFLLARADAAQVTVGHRPLSVCGQITGTRPKRCLKIILDGMCA